MDCRTVLVLMDAYLDGELDRVEARALEAHLDACADCPAALAAADALRRSLREPSLRHRAPPALRERVRSTLDAATTEFETPARTDSSSVTVLKPRGYRATPAWFGIAAACLLAFGAGGLAVRQGVIGPRSDESSQLERDLFASHWRALAATSPVDVVSSDHHTVKPWFAGRIAESPPVQDFAAQGFALVGGRIDYVGTRRVAVLTYRHGAHLIDVYVLPPSAAGSLPAYTESQGYSVDAVMLGTQPGAMVTDMDATERSRFADLLRGIR